MFYVPLSIFQRPQNSLVCSYLIKLMVAYSEQRVNHHEQLQAMKQTYHCVQQQQQQQQPSLLVPSKLG
jgi:hypothetical protein